MKKVIFFAGLVVVLMSSCKENKDEQVFMDSTSTSVNSEMGSLAKGPVKKWYADEDMKFKDGSVHHVKGYFRATYNDDGTLQSLTLYGELDGKTGVHTILVKKQDNGDLNFFWEIDSEMYEAVAEDMLKMLDGFQYEIK